MTNLNDYNYQLVSMNGQQSWFNMDTSRMTPETAKRFKMMNDKKCAKMNMQNYQNKIKENIRSIPKSFLDYQIYPKKRKILEFSGLHYYLKSNFNKVIAKRKIDRPYINFSTRKFFHGNQSEAYNCPKSSQLIFTDNNNEIYHLESAEITCFSELTYNFLNCESLIKTYRTDVMSLFQTITCYRYRDEIYCDYAEYNLVSNGSLVIFYKHRRNLNENSYGNDDLSFECKILMAAYPNLPKMIDFNNYPYPNDNCAVIAYRDNSLAFVDLNKFDDQKRSLFYTRTKLNDVCKYGENQMIASGFNHYLKLFDKRMFNRSVIDYKEHINECNFHQINIDHKNNLLISSGSDNIVRFWNISNGNLCHSLNFFDYYTNDDVLRYEHRARQAYFAENFSLYHPDDNPIIKNKDTLILFDGFEFKFLTNEF